MYVMCAVVMGKNFFVNLNNQKEHREGGENMCNPTNANGSTDTTGWFSYRGRANMDSATNANGATDTTSLSTFRGRARRSEYWLKFTGATDTTSWFSFRGRARRREYWLKFIFVIIPALIFGFAIMVSLVSAEQMVYSSSFSSSLTDMPEGISWKCDVLAVILGVAVFLLLLPVTVRRLHDRNMSGWFLLLFLLLSFVPVPFVGWIIFIVLLAILCLEGTVGPNEFGADPKANEHAALLRSLKAAQTSNDAVSHGAQPNSGIQCEASVRLKMLQELRAQGLISDTEYEEKRSKVLETI